MSDGNGQLASVASNVQAAFSLEHAAYKQLEPGVFHAGRAIPVIATVISIYKRKVLFLFAAATSVRNSSAASYNHLIMGLFVIISRR